MNAISMRRLHRPDLTVAVRDVPGADPRAVPLVLLHGGVLDARMWEPQLPAFPERRVVAPDARGHGGSSDADAPHRLADDVVDLLDALDIERAVLVGISMGGATAVDVALEHPERVAAVVCGGAGTSEPEFTDPWVVQAFADLDAAERTGDLDAWSAVWDRFTIGPHRAADEVDPQVIQQVSQMAQDTVRGHIRLTEDGTPIPPVRPTPVARTWERVPGISVPLLAVCGELDSRDHLAMAARLAEEAPQGKLRTIPAAAHYPNLERPVQFTALVRELLAQHGL